MGVVWGDLGVLRSVGSTVGARFGGSCSELWGHSPPLSASSSPAAALMHFGQRLCVVVYPSRPGPQSDHPPPATPPSLPVTPASPSLPRPPPKPGGLLSPHPTSALNLPGGGEECGGAWLVEVPPPFYFWCILGGFLSGGGGGVLRE